MKLQDSEISHLIINEIDNNNDSNNDNKNNNNNNNDNNNDNNNNHHLQNTDLQKSDTLPAFFPSDC